MKPKRIFTLTGKKLRCAAMPLGGIGTGTIAIGGDGLLKQWQITNTVNHQAFVPNSFFAIKTTYLKAPGEKDVTRALICTKPHEESNFVPALSTDDHRITSNMRKFFNKLPHVENIIFDGEYPVSFLKFEDSKLPVEIELNAFNPFIPLDPKNSGLPVVIFQFHIKNISNKPIEVTLLGNLFNFLGWDGLKTIRGEIHPNFGGNHNSHKKIDSWNAIYMKSETLLKTDKRYGNLTFAIDQQDVLISPQWDNLNNFWSHFTEKGTLLRNDSEERSELGKTWTGSIGTKKIMEPNQKEVINFFVAWNFPNRLVDWHINKALINDTKSEYWIGNRYNEWFKNSLDVIKYVKNNKQFLFNNTSKFHDAFYASTLPSEVLTSISATFSTIRTPTCMWIRNGAFHGFEGCEGASTAVRSGGCCPLDCTHVWNYEFSLAHLFPTLERTMRETEFKTQHKLGYLPHRAVIPLYLPQFGEEPDLRDVPPAIDGMFGMILKIYRDYLITYDNDFLKKSWGYIEKLMEFIINEYYDNFNGIITRAQPNTYDCLIYGLNTFIGSLNLCALLACEKIAIELNLPEWAQKCKNLYNFSRTTINHECWNGEFYIQKYDDKKVKEFQYGIGCHSDQLLGQWWAFHLGFGFIFPPDRVKKALESIVKYNFKETFEGFKQTTRIFVSSYESGLVNCTWPHGGKPKVPIGYTDEVFTGVEYEIAAQCIYTGNINTGLKMIKAIRNRYDGTHRNPWNEVECGDHYVRPMSSWTLIHALTGIFYSTKHSNFSIAPKVNINNFQSFFITNSSWGTVNQRVIENKVVFSISISFGELLLKSINLAPLEKGSIKEIISCVVVNSANKVTDIESKLKVSESTLEVSFLKPLTIKENLRIQIELQ